MEQQDRNGSANNSYVRRWRSFNPLFRRAGSIAPRPPLGPPRRAEVEHWDEVVRCLSVDPVDMTVAVWFRWV